MSSVPATATERPRGKSASRAKQSRPRAPVVETGRVAECAEAPAIAQAAWLCGLLQAGDSFYPTGSYAHSFGLEGLVQAGAVHDLPTLRAFVFRSVLPALRHVELPLAAHAWRAFQGKSWNTVGAVCVLSAAIRTPREARAAAENIGRQRAELLANLRGHPLAREYLERAATARWPFSPAVSAALEGCVLGAPLPGVLAGISYATLAASLSAAMKLLRLGQNASQALLTAALQDVPKLVADAAEVTYDDIGWFNPWLDIAAARHEFADARMFIS